MFGKADQETYQGVNRTLAEGRGEGDSQEENGDRWKQVS